MMNSQLKFLALVLLLRAQCSAINTDGVILLSFKFSITSDPHGVLQAWNYDDTTPCSWNGVSCGAPGSGYDNSSRVTGLSLPGSGLVGSIPATLGLIQQLQTLNLSNNSINGSIPYSLFDASELEYLDFSDNLITGGLPELVGNLHNLRVINLSGNLLSGNLPVNLTALRNLTAVSLRNNYFSGSIPGGFNSVRVLDLSSNLINGSLPPDFNGENLAYFNVSFNRLTGDIQPEFGAKIPTNATLDLSFNNLTGPIPESNLFSNQLPISFTGNPKLCGKPVKNPCPVPSSADTQLNSSSPAIAAMPNTINPETTLSPAAVNHKKSGLSKETILGIVTGDVALFSIVTVILCCVWRTKKKRRKRIQIEADRAKEFDAAAMAASTTEEYNWLRSWTCLKKQRHAADEEDEEESISDSSNSEGEDTDNLRKKPPNNYGVEEQRMVTVNGEKELELETLLKASAYILGASGSSIMYKAVLDDGTVLAVRRIGESTAERFRDFENRVRVIAKLVHPNLVRIRGFYWGMEEKLIVYDFVPNGSLASIRHTRKSGSAASSHLPWELRLKIAKGLARGLCYIHEKKHVHGNLKPSNILLGLGLEPKIGDFGLERLANTTSSKVVGISARNFGSKRSNASRESFQDFSTPSPSPSEIGLSPYHAPESLRSLKPNPKWDVFSFGVVLLELVTGRIVGSDEINTGLAIEYVDDDNKRKVLRMCDVTIRTEMEGKEDALLDLLKLGFGCVSGVAQKRPSMKEVVQALERFPNSSYY